MDEVKQFLDLWLCSLSVVGLGRRREAGGRRGRGKKFTVSSFDGAGEEEVRKGEGGGHWAVGHFDYLRISSRNRKALLTSISLVFCRDKHDWN